MTGPPEPSGLTRFQVGVARSFFSLPESLLDLAVDAPARREPSSTPIGPTFDPEELAGRKLLALFDRAEARDFADVRELAGRFGADLIVRRAAEIDAGFDTAVLAEMIDKLGRFPDDELPAGDPADLRAFFLAWARQLRT